MRTLALAATAALAFAAAPAADARQSNDLPSNSSRPDFGEGGGDYRQSEYGEDEYGQADYGEVSNSGSARELERNHETIGWIAQLEADLDSGSLLLIRPEQADGGMRAMYVPVDRDDVINMLRLKVALGEITAEQGAAILITMAANSGRHRRELRQWRKRLEAERDAARRGPPPPVQRGAQRPPVQPWEMGRPPAQPAAPQAAACPPATRWQVEVTGSQYSYHYVLVFRDYGTPVLVMPSGEEMTWLQTQGRLSGSSITVNMRDANGSGSLTAALSADCMQGRGNSQSSNGNNGPAVLRRLN